MKSQLKAVVHPIHLVVGIVFLAFISISAAVAQTSDEAILVLEASSAVVPRVSYSSDGRLLLSSQLFSKAPFQAILWDAETGEIVRALEPHEQGVGDSDFSSDGALAATVDVAGNVHLWDVESGESTLLIENAHRGAIYGVAFSSDDTRIVTGGVDKLAKVWDTTTGELLLTLKGHRDYIGIVAYAPDDSLIATSSGDTDVILWDAVTGENLRVLSDHTGYLWDVAFSPDGLQLVTAGGPDRTARLWEVETGEVVAELEHPRDVQGAAWSFDGQYILTGSADKNAYLWDVATGEIIQTFTGHTDKVNGVAL
ncbi:MAG: WD40 repeat domain-containing protein, partial [Armatimonadetes bacterium]|nr:WD40 repeat domain-containing protein [Anaerolineae bacterium]